jgi:hypothetical protein
MTFRNPGPGLRQAQTCGVVKSRGQYFSYIQDEHMDARLDCHRKNDIMNRVKRLID